MGRTRRLLPVVLGMKGMYQVCVLYQSVVANTEQERTCKEGVVAEFLNGGTEEDYKKP
jgi:hypothetical protein